MPSYIAWEDSGAELEIDAPTINAAFDQAIAWASEGEYTERVMVQVRVQELDADGERIGWPESREVEAGPEPKPLVTECGATNDDHDWQSPWPLVGGIVENPGVWADHGTGLTMREVCARCGIWRETYWPGSDRDPGHLRKTITYAPASSASIDWARRSDEAA